VIIFLAVIFTTVLLFSGPKIINYAKNEIDSFKLDDSNHSVSNKSRFGIQYALYKVFLENPLIGVGYGQQTFESRSKFPYWAKQNNWEFKIKYLNQKDKSFPPGYNLYLRLAAETGIIGLSLFLLFLAQILLWCHNSMKNENNVLAIIIFISMIGFILNWSKIDTFRIYGFWICLSLIFCSYKAIKNE
jgi:O-antigen ligase